MSGDRQKLENIAYCARYAFMPNRLHLCGPENQADVLEFYSKIDRPQKSIEPLLEKFETMFPYLKMIAAANREKDPFEKKIAEAYWIGNEKLMNVPPRKLFDHLRFNLRIDKSLGFKDFGDFKKKFNQIAPAHHNFHVFSVLKRTGNTKSFHTLASMDACRISWGIVDEILPGRLKVKTKPLAIDARGRIFEGDFIQKIAQNNVEGVILLKGLKKDDCVSMHWGAVCEKLNKEQLSYLKHCARLSFEFANLK